MGKKKQSINAKLADDFPILMQKILNDCQNLTNSDDKLEIQAIQEKHKSLKIILQNIELLMQLNPQNPQVCDNSYQELIEQAHLALNNSN